jgi:Xaa-Pro dipeptidase
MSGTAVNEGLIQEKLLEAQQKARDLLGLIEKNNLIRVGVTEKEVTDEIFELAAKEFGVSKHWHKRIVRTGINTVLTYKENPENRTIENNDLVYADLGPVFDGFEGDIGKTYLVGDDPDKKRLVADLERIFDIGKDFYVNRPSMTGAELYEFIIEECNAAGWIYGNNTVGHVVGEFSHNHMFGDGPENNIWPANTLSMTAPGKNGRQRYWILEIHLVDQDKKYGGFFEDILL